MSREFAYAALMTAASAVPSINQMAAPSGPVVWDLGGVLVPVVPALIGILATLLVRIIIVTSSPDRRNLRIYNVSVTLLTMLGTGVWITDAQLGPGAAFWTGIGCGAAGVGLIELSRSQFMGAFRAGLRTMFQAMFKSGDNGGSPPAV